MLVKHQIKLLKTLISEKQEVCNPYQRLDEYHIDRHL